MPGGARVFPAKSVVIALELGGAKKIYENFAFEIPLISMKSISLGSRNAVAS